MKVLIISHNVMGNSTNMGKTLNTYFGAFENDEIAQLYLRAEIPSRESVCKNFFRITDVDAIKSILHRKKAGGKIKSISLEAGSTNSNLENVAYKVGARRTGLTYILRNFVWQVSAWFSPELKKWLDDFGPDVVFFASGDYAFAYNIALNISKYTKAPLVANCVDDYYLFNKNNKSFLGRAQYKMFMHSVNKMIAYSSCMMCICEKMGNEYQKLFSKKTYIIHTPAEEKELKFNQNATQISYIGNLGLGRNKQLAEFGRTLKVLHRSNSSIPEYIDVYSKETLQEVLAIMTEENGIRFHGMINEKQVLEVMENSAFVIHTESFEPVYRERVKYSVSTKIAESLLYGPCMIAFGPNDVASIEYLEKHNAAYIIDSKEQLFAKIEELYQNLNIKNDILKNARKLGKENHLIRNTSSLLKMQLEDICNDNIY